MGKTLIGARVLSGSEEQEQMQVIAWARLMARKDSALKMLFHIPNGGKRGKLEAIRFKKMGVLAGVPDLFLPAPRKGYAGLFIEMKVGGNRITQQQAELIHGLSNQGYLCSVCYGADAAIKEISDYLGIRE